MEGKSKRNKNKKTKTKMERKTPHEFISGENQFSKNKTRRIGWDQQEEDSPSRNRGNKGGEEKRREEKRREEKRRKTEGTGTGTGTGREEKGREGEKMRKGRVEM